MTKVLLVAEDIPLRRYILSVLETEGYAVTGASTAKEAFSVLATSPERMVAVFDYALPDADAEKTLLQIMVFGRPLERHSYILFTSGMPSREVQLRAEVLGVQFVQMPAMLDHLMDVIREAEQRLAAAN